MNSIRTIATALLLAPIVILTTSGQAAPPASSDTAASATALDRTRRLLALPPAEFKTRTEGLSPREAENMISQIIHLRSARNPDLVRLHQILRHLETIRATGLAGKRLNRLLLVLVVVLTIFSGLLLHTSFSQRRMIQKLPSSPTDKEKQEKKSPLYRGEDSS